MRKKTFTVLLALCAIAAVATAAYLYLSRPKAQEVPMGSLLYPDLDVNAVARIDVASSAGSFSVKKTDGGWIAGSDFYYPADFTRLVRFLKGLADLKVGRAFPADREALTRLSLLEPGGADAKGQAARFNLYDKDGKKMLGLLAGVAREGRETQQVGGGQYRLPVGQYVRKEGSDTVYVLDRFFEMEEQKPADWMDKMLTRVDGRDIMDIKLSKVENGREEPIYELARPEKGKEFDPVGFAPDAKLARSEVNRMSQFLSALSFDGVSKADPAADRDGHVFTFTLANGVVYSVRFAEPSTPLGCTVAISASYVPDRAVADTLEKTVAGIAARGEAAASGAASLTPAEKSGEEKAAEIAESVRKTNDQLTPWVFTLGKWRCDSLIRSREGLVEK